MSNNKPIYICLKLLVIIFKVNQLPKYRIVTDWLNMEEFYLLIYPYVPSIYVTMCLCVNSHVYTYAYIQNLLFFEFLSNTLDTIGLF